MSDSPTSPMLPMILLLGSLVACTDDIDPEEIAVQVDASGNHACALMASGSIRCWGYDEFGQADDRVHSSKQFTAVDAGMANCGLRTDGRLRCWGNNLYGDADPPEGTFVFVDAAAYCSYAIDESGDVVVWGSEDCESPPLGPFVEVRGGAHHYACARRSDGSVECWGVEQNGSDMNRGQLDVEAGEYQRLDCGHFGATMALRTKT